MKRLITFLHSKCRRSVMTLLLLFAAMSGVWAADSNYLRWGIDGQSQSGSTSITYDGDGTATLSNLKANTTYWFDFTNDSGTNYGNTGTMTSTNCTGWKFESGKGSCKIETTVAGDYVLKVSWKKENGTWYPWVDVTYPTGSTGETAFYLVGELPGASWSTNDNFKFSPDGTGYSITLKGSDVSGKQFKLISKKGTTESYIAGPSSENKTITLDSPVEFTGDGGKNYVFPQLDSNAEYIMTLTMTSSSAGEFVVKKKDSSSAKYYLIVPNANVENTNRYVPSEEFAAPAGHKAFRLKASRERNSTVINNDLTTLALKLDGRQLCYNTNDEIEFYIQSSDGTVYMQPKDNDDDDTYIKLALKARNDVDYYATRTGTYSSNQNRYYKIRKNDTNPTDGSVDTKTLVFMFSKGNASKTAHINNDNKNVPISKGNSIDGETTGRDDASKDLKYNVGKDGNLIVGFLMSRGAGSQYYKDHIKEHGLYLVGSIAQTNYTHDKSHPMEKRYWKDGRIVELSDLGNDEAKADSIVYNCLVRKTGRSWDDFFLSFSTGDVVEGTGLWNLLLRPCVQDQMDAQELGGGVTFYQYDGGDKNNGQSLNPLLSEEQKKNYASYRVYFNATYSTYRIEFYDNFCIAGPAVNGQSNDTSKSGTYFDADHRHGMLEETVNGRKCYRYRGEFKKGSTFAFFVNPVTSALYYCEDNDNAAVNSNTGDRWHTQAPVGEDNAATGADYPYHNKVAWQTDGSSDINAPGLGAGNAILWTLPDGVYTLRFYNHEGNTSDVDHTKALYTIDKEVELKNASSTFEVWNEDKTGKIEKTFEYGGLRTFSDDCALMLPLGVKAYYANSIDAEKGKVILKEVPGNIIPAHCPVIIYDLSMKAGNKGLGRTAVKTINLCPVPGVEKEYTKTLKDMVDNKADKVNYLVDLSTVPAGQTIQPEVDGKYNFCMTNQVNLNGDYSKKVAAPLNFWRAKPGAAAKKNYTYLSVDKDIRPVFYTGAQNYVRPDASEDIANSKRSYCFILSFGDVDDDNVVTGITSVNVNDKTADSNAWYTIQGIRIAAPAVPGMYIHNGKKVVLK